MSTKGKEYKLAIKIAGSVDKTFKTSLKEVDSSLKSTIASIDSDFTKLDKGFDKIMGVGTKCFSAIATAAGVAATAIGAATAASISVGNEFESAFAGVKKTVEATEEEYEQLRQSILDMTREIPSDGVEIAGVMEIAGQLGIAKASLLDFTETMISMGVSTNLAAEDAATAMARFSNIVGMEDYGEDGISNFERLGSVVVDLGNHFATTEEEIVNIAEALAAAGSLAGMSESDIMGISAAMSSVGLTAEAGASSMSRLIMQMQQAVAEGGTALGGYAKTAGMSSKEFAALFRGNASSAVVKFIEGLNAAGEGSYEILEDLELSTIRTRKAFLSLAGADDLLINSVTMANEAWEENTALAVEAGKRYETTESHMQIMQNAAKELGIVAYDDLRGPFLEVIGDITEGLYDLTEYAGGPNGVGELIDNIGTELPTLQRKFKKYGEPVLDGIVGAGKFIVKHGNGITSVLVGIGGAMAAYKIASTLTHIVATLSAMNPATLGIVGTAAVIGGIVSAVAAYKQHEQDLVNSNLAEHFGDIALSMEDIKAIAEHIVSSDSLGGIKEALEAFKDIDVISDTMENSIEELNKMNWKVSIGMKLTPDENESYKTAIAEYVSAAQEYVEQSMYAVSLNLTAGLGDGTVADKVNEFYMDAYETMAGLGKDLSSAVNEAFSDNILDPSEIGEIANIQAKMAELQKSLAAGEFDAQLSLLQKKYLGGGSLTADSFQNLQAEIADQIASATKAIDESYVKNLAAIEAAKGNLTSEEYLQAIKDLEAEYLKSTGDLQAKGLNFQIDAIMQQYGDEVGAFQEHLDTVFADYFSEDRAVDWEERAGIMYNAMAQEIFSSDVLSDTTKKAIEELLSSMEPTMEQTEELKQRYEELGIEITDEMVKAIANFDLLGAMTVRQKVYGQAGNIGSLYDVIQSGINNRATGGLATRPELTWFAENGPEMAIPIDGSRNAISLWEQTGRLLGMGSVLDGLDLGGSSGHTIEYSPTLQFYGGTPSKGDLEDALRVSQDEFDGLMERYFKTHSRVSFG